MGLQDHGAVVKFRNIKISRRTAKAVSERRPQHASRGNSLSNLEAPASNKATTRGGR